MIWIEQLCGQFTHRSDDHHYAIAKMRGEYQSLSIPALWANPVQLASCASIEAAQKVCEQHRDRMIAENNSRSIA